MLWDHSRGLKKNVAGRGGAPIAHKKYLIVDTVRYNLLWRSVRFAPSPMERGVFVEHTLAPPSSISFFVDHAEQVESKETQEEDDKEIHDM
jgi:hypothetical protein